jgi:hypothetical protein
MNKTANQAYREYKKGHENPLPFAEWMQREKTKGFLNYDGSVSIPVNKPLTDSINQALENIHKQAGLKTGLENKYIFGIPRTAWIIGGVLAVGAIGYVIYNHTKK